MKEAITRRNRPDNPRGIVTGRVKKKILGTIVFLGIGLDVARALDMQKGDRVNIYFSRTDPDILLIKQAGQDKHYIGLKLWSPAGSNFLTIGFSVSDGDRFIYDSVMPLQFDLREKKLLVNLKNVKRI